MSSLFSDLSLLARANLNEALDNMKDPKRELQEKISALKSAWESGRIELAQAGAALATYEEKEQAIQEQLEFHEGQAEKFIANDKVAYYHLQKAKTAQKNLADAQKETAKFKAELENQQVTLDAVAERLETLQKALDKIKLIDSRGEQLTVLRRIAAEEKEAQELEESAVKKVFAAEARLGLAGIDVPTVEKERDPELVAQLEALKKKKGKKGAK